MKILSVYQECTKNADGKLPKCDYYTAGSPSSDMALFEAAPDLLAACKRALQQTDPIARAADYKMIADAIAKAEGPWSNKAEAWRSKDWPLQWRWGLSMNPNYIGAFASLALMVLALIYPNNGSAPAAWFLVALAFLERHQPQKSE